MDKKLYSFEKLDSYIKRLGIPVYHRGVYLPIVKELSIDEQLHNIRFTEEGVEYTDENGKVWLGFVYKKHFAFTKSGKNNTPRMHLCHCGVTDTWGEEAYMFANTLPITVYNSSNDNAPRKLSNIRMCGNCIPIRRNMGWNNYKDAKEYIAYIKSNYNVEEESYVNRWGYTKDWYKVRRDYILSHDYICERCGRKMQGTFLQSCLYVYHKDRDLSNNKEENLQCLCVDCYMKAYGVRETEELKIKFDSLHAYLNGTIYRSSWHNPRQLTLFHDEE